MRITEKTKISELIKHNPAAIDAIASINKHFEKLKNPILRKIMASRVNIADAAKIGGCGVEVFFEKLGTIGFHYDGVIPQVSNPVADAHNGAFFTIPEERLVNLDVRQEIASGGDPFQMIMKEINGLLPGQALKVINTFEPVPLIKILEKKGYTYHTANPSQNEYHTYFMKNEAATVPSPDKEAAVEPASGEFARVLSKYQGNLRTVDVREMEMPMPMVTILEELETLPEAEALFVYHHRVPKYLIAELEDRGFKWTLEDQAGQQVNIIIYRK